MASDLNTEVENRISSDENIQNQIDVIESGQLGPIKPTDAAPTPARNGNYTFSIGGAKPAWLTSEAGVTTVKAGDGVAVVYTAPSTYSYTHVDVSSNSVTLAALNDVKPDTYSERDILLFKGAANRFEKLSLNYLTGNLFSISGLITTSGTHSNDASRLHTDYLRIAANTDLVMYGESNNQYVNVISFYDSDKVYISGISNNQGTISEQTISSSNIPANAVYIRVSTTVSSLSKSFIHSGNIQSLLQAVETRLIGLNSTTFGKLDKLDNKLDTKLDKKVGKNLFNKDAAGLIDGKYLTGVGILQVNTSYFVSEYIPVLPNATYVHSNFGMGAASSCIYDAGKNFISSFQTGTVTVPANGYFIRMSGLVSNKAIQQFELGTVATSYAAYIDYFPVKDLQTQLTVLSSDLTSGLSGKLDKAFGKNLFNPNDPDILVGYYIGLIGEYNSNPYGINTSGFIPISSGQTLKANFDVKNTCVALYDANKNYVPGSAVNANIIAWRTGAVYARFSYYTPVNNYQIEVGTVSTTYEPYTIYGFMGNVKTQVPTRETVCILPKKMYFVKGKESCLYYENVLFKNLHDPTTLYFDKGINYNRQATFNFSSAATNQTFNAQVIRSFKKGQLKTITYDVIDPVTNNGKTVNALHIGDSFTDIGSWVKEVKSLLSAQGVTYNLIGTCGDSTFRAEGLSGGTLANTFLNNSAGIGRRVQITGVTTLPSTTYPGRIYRDSNGVDWAIRSGKIDGSGNGHMVVTRYKAVESDFTNFPASGVLTKQGTGEGDATINYSNPTACYFNPFINPSTGSLDITNYINTWGFEIPNLILFQFTVNDAIDWSSDSSLNSLVSSFKLAADHIHSAYPNAKVIFSIEPIGSINGNRDWNGRKYTILRLMELLLIQFEDDTNYNTWVKIAPSYAFVDPIYGYASNSVTPCSRYPSVTENSGGDGVHPNTGMLQIADCVSQVVSAII